MIRRGWLVLVAACHGAPAASIDASPVTTAAPDASDVKDASLEAATAPAGMLAVPAGTFTMGADQGGEEDERPAHRVTLAGFFLDRTPVTNEAYEACVKAGACAALYARDPKYTPPLHPVNTATWDEAKAYCAWRGARLPREAEYERAMRGDDGRTYAWGSEWPTPERATF
ncbi:MAG TPA: SUMF1/EgtB/PvdO family nonheme iron enzyme, partial [Polyangiaceae bacterium]|nr:SUMF1/EgtB/PvdO family nonheme iron enzyme [Polyangiaceae bacterium]